VLQWLDAPAIPWWSAIVSLVIGLVFAFVRAPHPWGWEGIDQYHELARALARGEPFGTTDVPWGYAYFVAAFYAALGDRAWIPVLVQVIANAFIPAMTAYLVAPLAGRRVSNLTALLVGVFSFNTVYASTLASDSICTVLFLAFLLCFARGHRTGAILAFAASGLLAGLVPQFRPNLILLPLLMAMAYLASSWDLRRLVQMAVFCASFTVALLPWVERNYTLTGRFLPTSTHGGVQLWYGSLQVGPHLESRAYNPRSAFEPGAFDYTSLAGDPILVSAQVGTCSGSVPSVDLISWTDRDRTPRRQRLTVDADGAFRAEIPGQPVPTAVYYYFEAYREATAAAAASRLLTPIDGDTNPSAYFVSDDHLSDLDRHGDLLDAFDLIRLLRHVAWGDPLANARQMDVDTNGRVDIEDVRATVIRLLGDGATRSLVDAPDVLQSTAANAVLRLGDGSTLTVHRHDRGLITDVDVAGRLARTLVISRRPWIAHPIMLPAGTESCQIVRDVRFNDVFYRREVHMMGRYLALAFDNISRDPLPFLAASAYRSVRLFVLRGASDTWTAHQFAGSRTIYAAGTALSIAYLIVFGAGVVIAVRRRSPLRVLLLPIVYVPLTICFVLTNMRYTITVQPLMFAFVALTIASTLGTGSDEPRE
jgi:hypothetical protein